MILKNKSLKGITLILADFFALVVGILNGFFLPMVFSMEGYALFRTFTLYATYATVFSFGISDGLYLFYGGKDERSIEPAKTRAYYYFLIKLQVVVLIVLLPLSFFVLKDTALIFFTLFIFPLQLINFFRLYFRALGEFGKYSALQAALVVFELLNTLLIVFYLKTEQPDLFITIKILNHIFIALLLTFAFFNRHKGAKAYKLPRKEYLKIMKPGITVLVADIIAALIFSLDRWFVMALFSKEEFACYAFAISIMNLFLVFITSITNILYSYISKRIADIDWLQNTKKYALLVSSFFPACFFILQYVVRIFLPAYTDSLDSLWVLMLTLPFISVVNVVYINLYKAEKSVKGYIKRMLMVFALSFMLNVVASVLFGTLQAIAAATLIAFIFWYITSSRDFQVTRIHRKEIGFLVIVFVSYGLLHMAQFHWFIALLIYTIMMLVNSTLFYREELLKLLPILKVNKQHGGNAYVGENSKTKKDH